MGWDKDVLFPQVFPACCDQNLVSHAQACTEINFHIWHSFFLQLTANALVAAGSFTWADRLARGPCPVTMAWAKQHIKVGLDRSGTRARLGFCTRKTKQSPTQRYDVEDKQQNNLRGNSVFICGLILRQLKVWERVSGQRI